MKARKATHQLNVMIGDADLMELQAIRTRDGIPVAEQVRRALALWFATKRPAATPRKAGRS